MKKKGLTLIELIIAMSIASILILIIYGFMRNITMVYTTSNIQSNLQSEFLLAESAIKKEMVESSNVTILENIPSTFEDDLNYIYSKEMSGVEKIYIKEIGKPEKILHDAEGILEKISFEKIDDKNILILLDLEKANIEYTSGLGVYFINIPEDSKIECSPETITKGRCVSYK